MMYQEMVLKSPSGRVGHIEWWVDHYSIGSEGGSAWAWVGDDPEDMQCIGYTAKTRHKAIERVLEAIWEAESHEC